MKKKGFMKRILAYVLTMCMAFSGLFIADATVAQAGTVSDGDAGTTSSTIYFLNTGEWSEVGAYVYGDKGEVLGGWGSTTATAATELGDMWVKVDASEEPPYSIIFYNKANDAERAELYLETAENVYVTANAQSYTTQAAAEEAMGVESGTSIYFLNTGAWSEVGAYVYGDKGEVLGSWGSTTATAATELGGQWVKVVATEEPPYSIIFYNKANDAERAELYLGTAENVYVTANAQSYTTQDDAEAAMGVSGTTVVYFYNAEDWAAVYGYAYANGADAGAGWPGAAAVKVSDDAADKWWKVEIAADVEDGALNVIFNNNSGTQYKDAYVESNNSYVVADASNATVYGTQLEAEIALGLVDATRVWFYNVYGYETVKVHGWNSEGDLFSPQPLATRESADSNWYYIDVPAKAPFNLQFIDTETGEMQQGYVQGDNVYLATTDTFFSSKQAVEDYMNNLSTTVYFLNYSDNVTAYDKVYAYAHANGGTVGGKEWPGFEATVSDIGDNWWKIEVPVNALLNPFNLIINDGNGNQLTDVVISNYKDNYVTLKGDGVVYNAQDSAEISAGITVETVVYLLNNNGWENTSVYIYGRPGEALGGWPGTAPVDAPELGEKWQKITVPAKTPFNIIYFNKDADKERTETLLSSDHMLYVTGSGSAYGSQFEAEAACGMVDESELAEIYFYNSRGWGDINAYTYKISGEDKYTLGAGWPGTAAELAPEIGDNWWKIKVPMKAADISAENSFGIIFNDGVNQMPEGAIITDNVKIYTIVTEEVFATPEEAEAAAAADDYDDGCEEGPNADVDNYEAVYDGAGADLPYITYEAEDAKTNGEVLAKSFAYREAVQSEASGRQAVVLDATGEYVEFTLTEPANGLVLRYSIPDTADGLGQDATLSCYINGAEKQNLDVTSRYAWVYGSFPFFNTPKDGGPHRYYDELRVLFDEVMPAGTTIKLQKDADDIAANYVIDFIEMENVAAPLAQPANSLSVTEFGAVANDGQDDRAAFEACIEAATEQGKDVWIPAGNFDLAEEKSFTVSGVAIRGAGMWHTNLNGAGAAFKYYGTAKFYDFAMTGVSTIRDDSGDLAGFEGNGSRATNITIENIWMEHMKVGVWSCNTENMVIQGCRIRNTYADGINMCSGTHNSLVRNNNLRNTGDDAIASWPWLANCTGNVIEHNTIQVPTLANGVAIYGGGEFVVDSNYVADTICNGAGVVVGTEFQTPKSFTGTVTVKNNVLDRCGSMQVDEGYPIGAIWIWSSTRFDYTMNTSYVVYNNVMNDCAQTGITIECGNDLTGVNIQNNTINGATDAIYEYYPGGAGTGSGKIGNLTTSNLTGEVWVDEAPDWNLVWEDETFEPVVNESTGIELSTPSEDLIEDVFTEEELSTGVDMSISIVMKKEELSASEKTLVNSVLGKLKIGTTFDIELFKNIDLKTTQLTVLGTGIELTIDIPEEYLGKDYVFWMIRLHEDASGKTEATRIADIDSDPNTVTIKTDRFSKYVLAYEEKEVGGGDGGTTAGGTTTGGTTTTTATTTTTVTSPKTGDAANYLWALAVLAVGVVLVGSKKRASKENC